MTKKPQPTTIEEAVKSMEKIVGKQASKWARNNRLDYRDLYNEGMLGVCIAWNKFDASRNVHFTTYAFNWSAAYISSAAKKSWEVYNNRAPLDSSEYFLGEVTGANVDIISVVRELDKLDLDDQRIYSMRIQGETFQEISNELGLNSLHQARKRYLEIQKKVIE